MKAKKVKVLLLLIIIVIVVAGATLIIHTKNKGSSGNTSTAITTPSQMASEVNTYANKSVRVRGLINEIGVNSGEYMISDATGSAKTAILLTPPKSINLAQYAEGNPANKHPNKSVVVSGTFNVPTPKPGTHSVTEAIPPTIVISSVQQ